MQLWLRARSLCHCRPTELRRGLYGPHVHHGRPSGNRARKRASVLEDTRIASHYSTTERVDATILQGAFHSMTKLGMHLVGPAFGGILNDFATLGVSTTCARTITKYKDKNLQSFYEIVMGIGGLIIGQ